MDGLNSAIALENAGIRGEKLACMCYTPSGGLSHFLKREQIYWFWSDLQPITCLRGFEYAGMYL